MRIINDLKEIYKDLFLRKKLPPKDFSVLKHIPAIGDCILISSEGFVSDGIKWFEDGQVNHVALYVGGGDQNIIEAIDDGLKMRSLSVYFHPEYRIIVRRYKGITVDQAEQMKRFAFEHLDVPYDYLQFVTMAIYFICKKLGWTHDGWIANSKEKMICSEIYNEAARSAGIVLFDQPGSTVTPQDFLVSDKFITLADV